MHPVDTRVLHVTKGASLTYHCTDQFRDRRQTLTAAASTQLQCTQPARIGVKTNPTSGGQEGPQFCSPEYLPDAFAITAV